MKDFNIKDMLTGYWYVMVGAFTMSALLAVPLMLAWNYSFSVLLGLPTMSVWSALSTSLFFRILVIGSGSPLDRTATPRVELKNIKIVE